eukprot:scaffold143826_cov193-Phaeocystis_antarctica.AAC.1
MPLSARARVTCPMSRECRCLLPTFGIPLRHAFPRLFSWLVLFSWLAKRARVLLASCRGGVNAKGISSSTWNGFEKKTLELSPHTSEPS